MKNNKPLEQAVNLLIERSKLQRPLPKQPTQTHNGVIIAMQIGFVVGILFTIWYIAMHPNL